MLKTIFSILIIALFSFILYSLYKSEPREVFSCENNDSFIIYELEVSYIRNKETNLLPLKNSGIGSNRYSNNKISVIINDTDPTAIDTLDKIMVEIYNAKTDSWESINCYKNK
jgi:hypothetical protein